GDITDNISTASQFDALRRDIAIDRALNHDLTGVDRGADFPIRANREYLLAQRNAAFYLSVDVQIFSAGDLAFDLDTLADACLVELCPTRRVHRLSARGVAGRSSCTAALLLLLTRLPHDGSCKRKVT